MSWASNGQSAKRKIQFSALRHITLVMIFPCQPPALSWLSWFKAKSLVWDSGFPAPRSRRSVATDPSRYLAPGLAADRLGTEPPSHGIQTTLRRLGHQRPLAAFILVCVGGAGKNCVQSV